MEDKEKTFIAFLDDDNTKREDWISGLVKSNSYVEFIYKGQLVSIPWSRVLKIKEKEVRE